VEDDDQKILSFEAVPACATIRAALGDAGIPAESGAVLTVDTPLRTPASKHAAHRRTGAVAVDMEAAGVAQAAEELKIPWLALKAVVDGVEDPLPEFLAGCTTPSGDLRWCGVVRSLAGSREERHVLWQLGRTSRRAARTLCRALDVALAAWSP
jgi:adenosylhomocysteine nucleosidase